MSLDGTQDAALVEASLSGDREAFGQIVARYQSLVCALAAQANSATASQFFAGHWFFQAAQAVVRQMVWLQLLWLLPMLVLWRRVRAARGHPPQEASPAE